MKKQSYRLQKIAILNSEVLFYDTCGSNKDKNKKFIIDTITTNLKEGTEYSVVGGKFIYFPVAQFIGQIEIIKKLKEPQ